MSTKSYLFVAAGRRIIEKYYYCVGIVDAMAAERLRAWRLGGCEPCGLAVGSGCLGG